MTEGPAKRGKPVALAEKASVQAPAVQEAREGKVAKVAVVVVVPEVTPQLWPTTEQNQRSKASRHKSQPRPPTAAAPEPRERRALQPRQGPRAKLPRT